MKTTRILKEKFTTEKIKVGSWEVCCDSMKEQIDSLINNFIKKWIPEYYSHLVDNDENDGERLKESLYALFQSQESKALERVRDRINKTPRIMGQDPRDKSYVMAFDEKDIFDVLAILEAEQKGQE